MTRGVVALLVSVAQFAATALALRALIAATGRGSGGPMALHLAGNILGKRRSAYWSDVGR